jgi:hypothetical protein
LPVVCVIAVSSLAAIVVLAWLVREVAARAIEKAAPDQVAAVVSALAGLVSPFRWIWPWAARMRISPRHANNDASGDPSAGDKS